jgi:hypothetical protein
MLVRTPTPLPMERSLDAFAGRDDIRRGRPSANSEKRNRRLCGHPCVAPTVIPIAFPGSVMLNARS